ncbi:universal stress protein [Ichthyenterobacterium sp. W332]|uniref:Universal stress protein n=1 Tax=Microcosmobacter mediterraneus TaxID=3075607 RepID=A0ABU2YJF1_9FLAO|nr:universal stress protein [Ichthyenterobacterium sp. W332]MDT0557942.1 universal stress protein [Ichthyenterobacterium sp. W332]
MKNIIVPLGSSENSKNTLQYAVDFAKEINAVLYVLNAYYIPKTAGTIINVDDIVARERKQFLEDMIERIDTKGVDIKIIAAKGDVIDAVTAVNDKLGVDLIVVGPRPNDLGEELFLGRTSGGIIKQTDIPVLIVPENYGFKPIKRVLTAIKSGVIKNSNALKPLLFIINNMQARMHLLQVKTPDFLPEDLEFYSDLAAITSSYNSSENATLFQGVLEHLNAKNPDLICVFRRKRGFFKKLWEQNIIKKVDFESRLPLLVLKETE